MRWPRRSAGTAWIHSSNCCELAPVSGSPQITTEQIEFFLQQRGAEIALVLWPGTQYLSGQVFDLGRIAAAAHQAGCVVGFRPGPFHRQRQSASA